MLSRGDARRRVTELRRAWRLRSSRRSTADTAYAAYVIVVMGLFVAAPAVVLVLERLNTPAVLGALSSPAAPAATTLGVGLTWALAVWIGAGYGPVTIDPALVGLWAGTDLPRRAGLRRPFLQRTAGVAAALAGAVALVGAVLLADGGVAQDAAFLVLGGAVAGVIAAVAWLVGQSAARHAWWIGLAVAALAVVAAAWPPARWLAVAALAAPLAAPRLLDALRGPELLAQSVRWQSATTTARYGDLQSALGSLRALPRRGRRWRALVRGPDAVRFAVADLVGAWRTTGRSVTGALALTGAGAALAVAAHQPFAPVLGGGAAVLAFLALGVFCDGLRHAAALGARPGLFGYGPWRLFALHAVAPAVATLVSGVLAGTIVTATGRSPDLLALGLVLVAVLTVRAWGAAKGQLPVALLSPIPTPMGDLSGLNVAAWLADAPLVAALAGGGTVWFLAAGRTGDAVVVVGILVAVLLASLRRRVERL